MNRQLITYVGTGFVFIINMIFVSGSDNSEIEKLFVPYAGVFVYLLLEVLFEMRRKD